MSGPSMQSGAQGGAGDALPALDQLDHWGRVLAPLNLRPTAVKRVDKGTISVNYRVESDGGPLFVKVLRGKRAVDLDYEGALLWHLGGHRFPTPQPLRTSQGRPYLVDGPRLVCAFPWQVGEELDGERITAAHAGRVGELLGRLHLAAAGFRGQRLGIYTFDRIAARIEGFRARAADLADLAELAPVLPILDEEVAWLRGHQRSLGSLPAGTIHGDVFPDNLLWVGDRIVALLDFEQASRGRYTYDLAVALLAFCWRQGTLVDGLAWSLVSGYQRVRPLSPAERDALWTEGRLAALRFTVTRITDVLLPSLPPDNKPPMPGKDFRDFLARLMTLRARGSDAFGPVMGERPPLRAV